MLAHRAPALLAAAPHARDPQRPYQKDGDGGDEERSAELERAGCGQVAAQRGDADGETGQREHEHEECEREVRHLTRHRDAEDAHQTDHRQAAQPAGESADGTRPVRDVRQVEPARGECCEPEQRLRSVTEVEERVEHVTPRSERIGADREHDDRDGDHDQGRQQYPGDRELGRRPRRDTATRGAVGGKRPADGHLVLSELV